MLTTRGWIFDVLTFLSFVKLKRRPYRGKDEHFIWKHLLHSSNRCNTLVFHAYYLCERGSLRAGWGWSLRQTRNVINRTERNEWSVNKTRYLHHIIPVSTPETSTTAGRVRFNSNHVKYPSRIQNKKMYTNHEILCFTTSSVLHLTLHRSSKTRCASAPSRLCPWFHCPDCCRLSELPLPIRGGVRWKSEASDISDEKSKERACM